MKKSNIFIFTSLIFITSCAMAMVQTYMSIFLFYDAHASKAMVGQFYSISSFVNIFVSMLLAFISDTFVKRRKQILCIGILCAIVGYFIYGTTSNFLTILICSCTLLSFSSVIIPQIFALSSVTLSTSQLTFLRTMISVSYVVGPLIAATVVRQNQFYYLFLTTIVFYCIAFVIALFGVQNQNVISQSNHDVKKENIDILALVFLFLWFVIIQIVHATISNIFPIMITEKFADTALLGKVASFSALVEIACMFIITILSSKVSIKKWMCFGTLSGILFILMFTFASNAMVLLLSYIWNAIFYSITIGLGLVVFQKSAKSVPSIATTLFLNSSSIGKIISGFLVGMFSMQKIPLVLGFVLVIALVYLSAIKFQND